MALIEVCNKLLDTNLEFNGKPTLKYAQQALKEELKRLKEEQKKENFISIEHSREYLILKAQEALSGDKTDILQTNSKPPTESNSKHSNSLSLNITKESLKIDIFV